MFEAPYTEVLDQSPIPLITLQIRSLESSSIPLERTGILDTGADCTLVPFSVISRLQPKALIRGRDSSLIYGVGKQKIVTVPYRIALSFNQQNFIKLKIYACPDHATDELIILGRNFLNRYRITFDGLERKFTIA